MVRRAKVGEGGERGDGRKWVGFYIKDTGNEYPLRTSNGREGFVLCGEGHGMDLDDASRGIGCESEIPSGKYGVCCDLGRW